MTKQSSTTSAFIATLIALLPLGYLAIIWSGLPGTVPLHFGADLQPDRYGNKSNLWLMTGILSGVSVGVYFLLINLHRIDPKRRGTLQSSTFKKLAMGMVVFMAAISTILLLSIKGTIQIQRFLFPLMGLLLAFIGNNMHTIKPNYFAGIRLPWTLNSDENWRKTHQLAGKLWFTGGLLIALAGLVLHATAMFPVFISLMVMMTLIPVVYSYRLFRRERM